MNMNLTSCLKKDQNKLYLVELWWAWIEDLMSDISSDYFKKFRNVMIEKLKPKAFSEGINFFLIFIFLKTYF